MYNPDCSRGGDDVEGFAAAATKHLELLKQKDKAESSFIIEKIVGKLLKERRTLEETKTLSIVPKNGESDKSLCSNLTA